MDAIVPTGISALVPTSMESAMRLADMMARGKLVPDHLRNSAGDCLMVIEAAMRWGMSPFAVAQCTSVIQGKLMYEGKLVAAALNSSGIMAARLDYEFTGNGNDRAVIVRGTLKGETKSRDITLTLKDAKTSNGMWTKQPDQQLVYAGTRVWARRHAPEVMLGVYAPEEFEGQPERPFAGTTIEHAAAAPEPPATPSSTNGHAKPAEDALDEQNGTKWLKNLEVELAHAQSQEAVTTIAGHRSVTYALANAPTMIKARINEMLTDTMARFAEIEAQRADEPPGPADALIAQVEAMDFAALRTLDTNAAYRAELNALPADAARAVVEAVSGRLANLRAGA